MHPVPEQVEEGGICVGGGTDRGMDVTLAVDARRALCVDLS